MRLTNVKSQLKAAVLVHENFEDIYDCCCQALTVCDVPWEGKLDNIHNKDENIAIIQQINSFNLVFYCASHLIMSVSKDCLPIVIYLQHDFNRLPIEVRSDGWNSMIELPLSREQMTRKLIEVIHYWKDIDNTFNIR